MEVLSTLPILLQDGAAAQCNQTTPQAGSSELGLFAALLPLEGDSAGDTSEDAELPLPEENTLPPEALTLASTAANFSFFLLANPVPLELATSVPPVADAAEEAGAVISVPEGTNARQIPTKADKPSVKISSSPPPLTPLRSAENAELILESSQPVAKQAENTPELTGTPVAKHDSDMLSPVKDIEIADSPEGQPPQENSFKLVRNGDYFTPEPLLSTPAEQPAFEAAAAELQEIASTQFADSQESTRELVHSIREQAILLRKIDETELKVVVPAQEGSDLHLQLEKKDGVIEVSAACGQDCFANLNAHWEELKEVLNDQGIELQDLELSERLSSDAESEGEKPRHPQKYHQTEMESWDSFIPATVQFKSRTNQSADGWQSWA